MSDVTRILEDLRAGDATAASRLFELTYAELRRLAAVRMAGESGGQTLQATALVHEAWLRLGGDDPQPWQNRAHFFSAAAEAMRRILVDQARRKNAQRRGSGTPAVPLLDFEIPVVATDDDLLEVHEVLEALNRVHPEKAELVKLRYFVGLSLEQCAEVLGCSTPTLKRQWAYARAWMLRQMRGANSS
ncbi:MAG: sigma-70 family RNA polymerase sigma factor [Verrucomicrobiales bacterium]|nr:sigma-70 family RNA polymerase sigma factor [Verrucomicrobiales bacterium]